jgi:hypothetical protein
MFGKKLSTSCRRDTLLSALHKKIDSGRNCGKLGGFAAAVTDSCGKLSGATFTIFGVSFHNKNFKEQFSLATFGLSGASLKARLVLKGCSFGAISLDSRHLVATLRRSFREPLCRMALGSHFWCRLAALGPFGKQFLAVICGEAQWNTFGEQQLRSTAALPHKPSLNGSSIVMASLGSRFRKPLRLGGRGLK